MTVLLFSSIFNDGRALWDYANFARLSFFFANEPAPWFDGAVINKGGIPKPELLPD